MNIDFFIPNAVSLKVMRCIKMELELSDESWKHCGKYAPRAKR